MTGCSGDGASRRRGHRGTCRTGRVTSRASGTAVPGPTHASGPGASSTTWARPRSPRRRPVRAAPSAPRPADRDLAVRRCGPPPGQPGIRTAHPAGPAQSDDLGVGDRPLRGGSGRPARPDPRHAAVDRPAAGDALAGPGVRAPCRSAPGGCRPGCRHGAGGELRRRRLTGPVRHRARRTRVGPPPRGPRCSPSTRRTGTR